MCFDIKELGKQLKEARAGANLSQEELAKRIGVSRQTISNWENGRSEPDLETLGRIAELLGVEKPEISITHLEGGENYTYRGEPVTCDIKVCHIPMESFLIELHQPIGGPSTFQEFLDKHGNGVHHLGFEVGDARDDVIADLAEAGYDTNRTLGIYPGSSWTIVDSEDVLGVNLNIKPRR